MLSGDHGAYLCFVETRTLQTPGTLWRLAVDGGAAERLTDAVMPGFDLVNGGVYYLTRNRQIPDAIAIGLTTRPLGAVSHQFYPAVARSAGDRFVRLARAALPEPGGSQTGGTDGVVAHQRVLHGRRSTR